MNKRQHQELLNLLAPNYNITNYGISELRITLRSVLDKLNYPKNLRRNYETIKCDKCGMLRKNKMAEFTSKIRTIQWVDNVSRMVDQTLFPYEFKFIDVKTGQEMFDAIKTMIVRGAPAIGIAGAHGVVLYAQELAKENLTREEFVSKLLEKADYIAINVIDFYQTDMLLEYVLNVGQICAKMEWTYLLKLSLDLMEIKNQI